MLGCFWSLFRDRKPTQKHTLAIFGMLLLYELPGVVLSYYIFVGLETGNVRFNGIIHSVVSKENNSWAYFLVGNVMFENY